MVGVKSAWRNWIGRPTGTPMGRDWAPHYARLNSIEIRDTGEGMSFENLSDVYLRIGTRHRRRQNEEGATKLGDKGIGRLVGDALGRTVNG